MRAELISQIWHGHQSITDQNRAKSTQDIVTGKSKKLILALIFNKSVIWPTHLSRFFLLKRKLILSCIFRRDVSWFNFIRCKSQQLS